MLVKRQRAALDRLLVTLLVGCLGVALLPPPAPAQAVQRCHCALAGTPHECDCPHCHGRGAAPPAPAAAPAGGSDPAAPAAESDAAPPCHRGRAALGPKGGAPASRQAGPAAPRGAPREAPRPDAPCVSGGCGEGQARLLPSRSLDEFVLPGLSGPPPAFAGSVAVPAPALPFERVVAPELPPPRSA